MRISDWSSDVCSSDLFPGRFAQAQDEVERGVAAVAFGQTDVGDREHRLAAAGAHVRRRSAVARVRRAGREVRAVDVGVGAAAAVAQRGGGVAQPGRGVRALRAVGAAVADEVGVAGRAAATERGGAFRSEEHTSELQSLLRTSYAVFCLTKNT